MLLLVTSSLFAQLPEMLIEPLVKTKLFEKYDGSIWKQRKFIESKISNENIGDFIVNLRYNIYTDAMEFSNNSKELYTLKENIDTTIKLEDDEYHYCEFKTERGQNRSGYYILVELNDSYRVYKKYRVEITKVSKASYSGIVVASSNSLGSIHLKTTYYIEENGAVMGLPTEKKEILAILDNESEVLKKLMKKEKLRMKKEEDVLRVVSQYNTMRKSNDSSKSLLVNRKF